MAFDISTAKPVTDGGGFDISTARPVITEPLKIGKDAFPDILREELKNAGWLGRNLAGAGSAVVNAYEGLKGLVGKTDPDQVEAQKIIAESAPVGNIAGGVAMLAPTALIPGANTLAGAATIGAVTNALTTPGDVKERGKAAVLGGVGGAAGVGLSKVAGAVIGRPINESIVNSVAKEKDPALQRLKALADASGLINDRLNSVGINALEIPADKMSALHEQVVKALQAGFKPDPAAMLIKQDFDSVGIKPLLGQITRDPTEFAREMNLRGVAGVGEPIMARMTEQQRALQNGIGKYAGGAAERYQAGNQLIDSVRKADDEFSNKVSALYKAARESSGKDLDVPLQGLAQDYADILFRYGDKVPSGVRNSMDAIGLTKGVQTKVFTVEEADKLLKTINSNASNDPAVNSALGELRRAVKSAVTSADDSGGVFAPAVDAARKRFMLHDAIPALSDVAQGRVSPDDFVRKYIIGGKTNDVGGLSLLLDDGAKEQAKAQIGDYLKKAAFGQNSTGDKAFSQERFNKALNDIGTDKLRAFFSDDEIAQLKTLGRVGAYMTSAPAGAPINSSNTASALMSMAMRIPVLGRGAEATSALFNAVATPIKNNAIVKAALLSEPPVQKTGTENALFRLLADHPNILRIAGTTAAPKLVSQGEL